MIVPEAPEVLLFGEVESVLHPEMIKVLKHNNERRRKMCLFMRESNMNVLGNVRINV